MERWVKRAWAACAAVTICAWAILCADAQVPGELNVIAFGADPAGERDSTIAFRAASSANTNGAGLFVPRGRYLLSGPVELKPGRIHGEGDASELRFREPDSGLWAANTSGISIDNLKFSGTCSRPIFLHSVTNAVIRNCLISGATIYRNSHDVVAAIALEGVEDCLIESNRTFGNGTGTTHAPATAEIHGGYTGCRRVRLVNNVLEGRQSFFGALFFNAADCVFEGNSIDLNGAGEIEFASGYGIAVYKTTNAPAGPHGNRILRNLIRNTGGTGIYLNLGSDYVVEDNTLENVALKMTDRLLPVSGIGLNGVAASRLERNTIVSSGKAGFSVANGTNLLIVANRVESAQNEGIELRGFCERLNVLGNTIRNAGRGGISGRYLPTTVRNSLFEGNEILESSADGMKVPLAENAVFAGNFVVRIDGRGVLIQEGTGNFVQRNQIFGCRLEGISTGCAESIGWGNQIKGCSLAISDTAGTNNCWIGNIVSGNAKDIILSSGVVMDWFALANRR